MFRNVNESAKRLRQPVQKPSMDWAHQLMSALFTPLAKLLHRMNVSPNAITICGFLFGLLAGVSLALGYRFLSIAMILVSGFMDGVDGLLARQSQQTSQFGAFLDSVLDRWSDSAFYIGLLIMYSRADMQMQVILVGCALSSSLLVSYTRARAEGIGAQCSRGLLTRLGRFVILIAGLVVNQMTIALWSLATLSTFTALQRIYYTWKYVREHPENE